MKLNFLTFFPAARRILLPLLLEICVSTILLSEAQRHRASTRWRRYTKQNQATWGLPMVGTESRNKKISRMGETSSYHR